MISAIGTALTAIIGWFGDVLDALLGTSGDLAALLPLISIGIGLAIIGSVFSLIKRTTWGV